jgi:hypothetical protein
MPDPVTGIIAGGATLIGGAMQSRAAGRAAEAQERASMAGIAEQQRQFDEMQKLLAPYVEAGQPALQGMQAQIGLRGAEEQRAAIEQIAGSPLLQALTQQGEQALLQRASATGGLRGGNIQGALAQFRPAMLQAALDQQYARLGGLTSLGQQSAARVGTAGMQTGENVANLLGQAGAAQAGGIIGGAAPFVQAAQLPAQLAAFNFARGGGLFGGARAPTPAATTMPSWTSGYDLPMGGG